MGPKVLSVLGQAISSNWKTLLHSEIPKRNTAEHWGNFFTFQRRQILHLGKQFPHIYWVAWSSTSLYGSLSKRVPAGMPATLVVLYPRFPRHWMVLVTITYQWWCVECQASLAGDSHFTHLGTWSQGLIRQKVLWKATTVTPLGSDTHHSSNYTTKADQLGNWTGVDLHKELGRCSWHPSDT